MSVESVGMAAMLSEVSVVMAAMVSLVLVMPKPAFSVQVGFYIIDVYHCFKLTL